MNPIWFAPGDLAYLQPETDEEELFIRTCPAEWTWERVKQEWESVERGD